MVAEMTAFRDHIIRTEKEVGRLENLSPLQKITGKELVVFTAPGAGIQAVPFMQNELKGWVSEQEMKKISDWMSSPKTWTLYQLAAYLRPLPPSALKILNQKPCTPDSPEKSNCLEKQARGWKNRWIVYPGDYLCDAYSACSEDNKTAERTLIYAGSGRSEEVFYFGLKKENGAWVLHSIFSEDKGGDDGV